MTIRDATPEDVPAVLPLVQRLCDLHGQWDTERFDFKPDLAERYRRWLTARCADAGAVFLVAEVGGQVVAYLVGTTEDEIPIYWTPACGYIHDIWVDPDYRHEGLARQIVTLAVERFAAKGLKQVRLITAAKNDVGRAMFERCGFRVATVEMMAVVGEGVEVRT
jgi:ribosomal protein S18 acetylase RimI-like enzyme